MLLILNTKSGKSGTEINGAKLLYRLHHSRKTSSCNEIYMFSCIISQTKILQIHYWEFSYLQRRVYLINFGYQKSQSRTLSQSTISTENFLLSLLTRQAGSLRLVRQRAFECYTCLCPIRFACRSLFITAFVHTNPRFSHSARSKTFTQILSHASRHSRHWFTDLDSLSAAKLLNTSFAVSIPLLKIITGPN